MTKIEKVARALLDAEGFSPENTERLWSGVLPRSKQQYFIAARAAIEAMREPTPAMFVGNREYYDLWQKMIGAALTEEPSPR